ncbi:MAG: TMEM165/GDT1 family protein [Sphingomonadaceae bacterium]|nr:TMEM165/GDT1 family protein [Sphingomonadaceae bacterium]
MDLVFLPLVTAALAEWGDKTQLLALALAVRFGKPVQIIAGIAVAALASSLIGGFGGSIIRPLISHEASLLMLALAFLFAGFGGFMPFRERAPGLSLGAFVTSMLAFFALEIGDKTQFLALGFAAVNGAWIVTACAAAAGIVLTCGVAVVMGEALRERLPLRLIRRVIAGLFLLAGFVIAIIALGLV